MVKKWHLPSVDPTPSGVTEGRGTARCVVEWHGKRGLKKTRMIGAETPGCPESARLDALDGAGSPRLVFVREPDQLGVERAHPQLAFGAWLIELTEPNRHVAADDDRPAAGPDDDHLRAACVARRRDE